MAALAAIPAWVGPAFSIGSTLLSASSKKSQANAAQSQADASAAASRLSAEFSAAQHGYIAGQTRAVAQREADAQRKNTRILASRALAVAAASGAGASDPTVTNIIGDIVGEGAYRAALAMYAGEEDAKMHEFSAEALRATGEFTAAARTAEGKSIAKAGNISAFSTLLSGGASFFSNYGSLFAGK